MTKIVINNCWGGFGLSEAAYKELGMEWDKYGFAYKYEGQQRSDPELVRVVELLGKDADGAHAKLRVVEIPDGIHWEIQDNDGREHIA